MAEIVSVIASTHNPRIFWNREQADPTDMQALYATFGKVRALLAETKPNIIVGVANDHLDNFFFDNLPTFAVGTGPIAEGPFWYETDIMNLPRYRTVVHQDLAQFLLRQGIEEGVQFSQVHDFIIDHAFTVPLSFVRPEQDLPIVPIMTNAFGYPIPPNRRWYELGQFLRRAIEAWPGRERVAVCGSFNMTVEVGGPKMGNYNFDLQRWMLEQMRAGNRDDILRTLTVPRLIEEGNSTAEFLNYVTMLGVVEDRRPSFIEHKPVKGVGTCPVAFWNMAAGGKP
jgi:protocatechuate 4,5-dioxygenase beta chain